MNLKIQLYYNFKIGESYDSPILIINRKHHSLKIQNQ